MATYDKDGEYFVVSVRELHDLIAQRPELDDGEGIFQVKLDESTIEDPELRAELLAIVVEYNKALDIIFKMDAAFHELYDGRYC
jgi:hypothetical protein